MQTENIPERPKSAAKAKKEKPSKQPKGPTTAKPTRAAASKPVVEDPEAMFKVGFLSDVYQERPKGHGGVTNIITRVLVLLFDTCDGCLNDFKAIAINFGFAKYHGGECNLRFDDTNPAGEEPQYFDAIEEMVQWLGSKPKRVTYSSDNFDRLYALAEALIEKDKARRAVEPDIKAQRGGGKGNPRYACPHRDRPVAESMTEFRAMRDGKYEAGEAALRSKQNLESDNPQMWDLFAYRIPRDHREHHRTGTKWIMYPTYDFTHCLCDSFEGITHSLCTTEFEFSRESYEWLCDELEVYKPMQREYGRLNITGTVLSKRKILELVKHGYVCAWDDPRLYTLIALRRRGVPPGAILSFVNELGVTKATSNIESKRFEASVRRYLELTVPRLMLVLEPLVVIIDDLPDDHLEMIDLPFSKDPAHGSHCVPFTKTVYIERSDFREVDSDDYFRLAPGKTVGLLKVPFPITATSFEKDPDTGAITVVHAKYERPADGSPPKKPKSFIHWVASSPAHNSPIKATVRAFNPLFKSNNPAAQSDGFLADVNPELEHIFADAMIETGFEEIYQRAPWPAEAGEKASTAETGADGGVASAETDVESDVPSAETGADSGVAAAAEPRPETVRFQGMRVGYFCVDSESTKNDIVLNRILSLKEDTGKG